MTSRTAIVDTVSGKQAKVTVMYCQGCGKYYMNIISFKQYNKLYGGLLFEYHLDEALAEQNKSWLNFSPDTILSRCGYTVKAGTSEEYRHRVLAYIMDSKKASKSEIIEIISGFIRLRERRFPEACSRWRDDIRFVNQYKIDGQKVVYGLSFKQGGKITRNR